MTIENNFNTENVKEELIKRYEYLYENSIILLAPFMTKTNDEEVDLKISNEMLMMFEEFLLSDQKMKETKLYDFTEENKNNKEYLEKATEGLLLADQENKEAMYNRINLNIKTILKTVKEYIKKQNDKNINEKLIILNEYMDIANHRDYESICSSYTERFLINDEIISSNSFINSIINLKKKNNILLTIEEKEQIYLKYHDELPWNLKTICSLGNDGYERPEHTKPCEKTFFVKEEDIFINKEDNKFYHLCPYCGYIVTIDDKLLSKGIKERIEKRCNAEPFLFRKMELYSELKQLEKLMPKVKRKILTK